MLKISANQDGLSTFQLGFSLNLQLGPFNINGAYGLVVDTHGNVGTYKVLGGGLGAGEDVFGGLSFGFSNGGCIQDIAGLFANQSSDIGALAAGGVDVFGEQGSHGQPVMGGGFSIGFGEGTDYSAGASQTIVTPL